MHPHDNDDDRPAVRRRDSLTPDGEVHLAWAYDTPLTAPRRGLEAADPDPGAPAASARTYTPRPAHTISPLVSRRRDTPERTPLPAAVPPARSATSPLERLATAVFFAGVGALALAGTLAIAAGLFLLTT